MNAIKLFESTYHDLPFGILITDYNPNDPKIIYVNPKFIQITGYSFEELLGKNPKIFQGPKTDRAVIDRLKECLHSRSSFFGSTWNYRKNGEPYPLSWTINTIEIDSSPWFLAIEQDLSETAQDQTSMLKYLLKNSQISSRNLLNRISLASVLLGEPEADRAELTDIIQIAVRSLSDLSQLIEFITLNLDDKREI